MQPLKFRPWFFLMAAGIPYLLSIFYASAAFAGDVLKREAEQSSDGLEMIVSRMQELSRSLDKMPEPPVLNQTLEIPAWASGPSQKKKKVSPDPEK